MKPAIPVTPTAAAPRGFLAAWNVFWFTPRMPLLLACMRVCVGLVTLYTFAIHGYSLFDFMGDNAWYDGQLRREMIVDRPILIGSLNSSPLSAGEAPGPTPSNEAEHKYYWGYKEAWGVFPPGPYPANNKEIEFAHKFRTEYGFDFRYYGLPFPKSEWEHRVLDTYSKVFHQAFPPPYPVNEEEVKKIDEYLLRHGVDPRRLYARGIPAYSVWMHVVDPFWMKVIQTLFVGIAFCFVIGLGTRVTGPLTWFASICYIHRNQAVLFGVDTMMNVLLLYLMIGPSGAVLSVDRFIARWWARKKGVPLAAPEPSVAAGVAIRLLQVHLCIIYMIAGVAKLQGLSWWNGTAVWSVLANYEFAPMQLEYYNAALRFLGSNQMIFETVITSAGFFTLIFEIGYVFLIWRPNTRWWFLAGAIMLHGFIGMFMGLKTFSLMMLCLNMAFLKDNEVAWVLSKLGIATEGKSMRD